MEINEFILSQFLLYWEKKDLHILYPASFNGHVLIYPRETHHISTNLQKSYLSISINTTNVTNISTPHVSTTKFNRS